MDLFLRALILALAIDGVCLALFPGLARETMREALKLNDQRLRNIGLSAIVIAVALTFFLPRT